MRHTKIRSVGPQFFSDEEVVQITMPARLLLVALSTLADDQGVFRWKPVQIKGLAFPMDGVDIYALLAELVSVDLVREFEADGSKFGAIRGWGRHQKPRDARAQHPLPASLDEYVRLGDVPAPRERKGRSETDWPLRPRDGSRHPVYAVEESADSAPPSDPSPARPPAVPGTSPGQPRDRDGASHVEGSGGERRGVERNTPPPPSGGGARAAREGPERKRPRDVLERTLSVEMDLPPGVADGARKFRDYRKRARHKAYSADTWLAQLAKARSHPAAVIAAWDEAILEGWQGPPIDKHIAGRASPGGGRKLTAREQQTERFDEAARDFVENPGPDVEQLTGGRTRVLDVDGGAP